VPVRARWQVRSELPASDEAGEDGFGAVVDVLGARQRVAVFDQVGHRGERFVADG
jgi:hypothetical protein